MKKNLKAIVLFCATASLFCMSAQTDLPEEAQNQEISMSSCKEPETRADCQKAAQGCTKKGEKPPRKSAARKVIEGS